jgi:phosphinothricin acetyltransferase
MQIRQASLDDLDAIEFLWREMMDFHIAIDDYFTLIPEAETNHRTYMTDLLQDESKRVFVADDAGNILGYLVAEVNTYPPIFVHKNYGHIGAISVSDSARRQGLGRKLLEAALDWFREQNLRRVECGVAVNNPVSQGFWEAMGFRGIIEHRVLDLTG